MEIVDGRKNNRKDLHKKHREIIEPWFENNREKSMMDCHRDTGIPYGTIRVHVAEMRAEKGAK